jgi:hypothetical protein
MPFTFNLNAALAPGLKPLPVGATAQGTANGSGKWVMPWEALPLALHHMLNSGDADGRPSSTAVYIYEAETTFRAVMLLAGFGVTVYITMVGEPFGIEISWEKDHFMWIVLIVWWLALVVQFVSQSWGRFTRLPASIALSEVKDRPELNLPALIFNHQSFGLERWEGYIAAFLVTLLNFVYTASWSTTLYICVSRMVANDAYKLTYTAIYGAALFQSVFTALARSVSFSDLRSATKKPSSEPNQVEYVRIQLVCIYVVLVLVVLLPLASVGILYVRV